MAQELNADGSQEHVSRMQEIMEERDELEEQVRAMRHATTATVSQVKCVASVHFYGLSSHCVCACFTSAAARSQRFVFSSAWVTRVLASLLTSLFCHVDNVRSSLSAQKPSKAQVSPAAPVCRAMTLSHVTDSHPPHA